MTKRILSMIFVLGAAMFISGCADPRYNDGEARDYSDMPWNVPADWEGSPSIPGMEAQ